MQQLGAREPGRRVHMWLEEVACSEGGLGQWHRGVTQDNVAAVGGTIQRRGP